MLKGDRMSKECYLEDVSNINKILSDSLVVSSGFSGESMKYVSCKISDFNEDITAGVMIIFKDEKPVQIEFCPHVSVSIKKFTANNVDIEDIGVGIIYDIKNVNSQEKALRMIENYLGLIFQLD
jgi:hypothetical protein